MHLGVADPLADLALREVLHEAQLEHLALHFGKREPGGRDRVAVLDELVGGVLAAEHVDERGGFAVVACGRRVE